MLVRCLLCGAPASEWAARCPTCGADLATALPIPSSAQAESPRPGGRHPLAAGGRHLRLHRVKLTAIAVIVVAGTLIWLAVTKGPGRSVRPGASKGSPTSELASSILRRYSVLSTDRSGPRLTRLDGISASISSVPGASGPERPVEVSGGGVFLQGGRAYFVASGNSAMPVALGLADRLFKMPWPDVVGVQHGLGPGPVSVQFVSTAGASSANSPDWRLPAGYQPLTLAGSGLLVQDEGGQLRTWSLAGGQLGPILGRASSVIDIHLDEVAWRSVTGCHDGECPLHLTDASSGVDRLVSPPPSHVGFLDGGAFSPDGASLAAFLSVPHDRSHSAQLVLIDASVPSNISAVADSMVPVGEPAGMAAWTPDSTLVVFCGITGPMHAYLPGDARAVMLNIPASSSFVVW